MENSSNSSQTNAKPGMTTFWKVFIAIVVVLAVGASGWIVWYYNFIMTAAYINDSNSQISLLQSQVNNLQKQLAVATNNPTAGWQTYTSKDYNLSFQYPASLGKFSVNKNNPIGSPDGSNTLFSIIFNDFSFDPGNGGFIYSIDAAKNNWANGVNQLKLIYKNKNYSGKIIPDIPNNYVFSTDECSTPKYIQSSNGSFRGIYFYAIANNEPADTSIYNVIYMTNGTNIVVFYFSQNSIKAGNYSDIANNTTQVNEFKKYVAGLTDNSDETIVKNFNSIYKHIALSLKNL